MNWFEKYKPKKLDDFICFKDEIEKIKKWIDDYKNNYHTSKKVLLLIGQSGIGKTKMVEVLFEEYG
jgi:Holliday junction resolvasome RuvABC ATP-dependent DNA helicase subunit